MWNYFYLLTLIQNDQQKESYIQSNNNKSIKTRNKRQANFSNKINALLFLSIKSRYRTGSRKKNTHTHYCLI